MDHDLEYSLHEWAAVPTYAAEFESWDDVHQLDFVVEWAMREDALDRLSRYALDGKLKPAQERRYAELLKLVKRGRPLIRKLLDE